MECDYCWEWIEGDRFDLADHIETCWAAGHESEETIQDMLQMLREE